MSSLETDASTMPRVPTPHRLRLLATADPYDELPIVAQQVVSRHEWAWLNEHARARLIDDLCTPDWID